MVRSPLITSLFAVLAVAASACGTTTHYTQTNPPPRQMRAKAASQVHVYTTGKPKVAYAEVGIIQSRQSSRLSFDDMPEIIAEMRKEAGKRGCDGVIINGTNNKTVGSHDPDHGGSTGTLEGFWGACIVYGSYANSTASRGKK